ncbi:hypothetical protein A3781_06365 [Bacillus badius]|nr:hypothetical protein A3781_06365 [Bacillus badius]
MKRKETIERVFADAKEKHGMRWTTLRGLKKIVDAGDAYFRCHESQENGQLDLAGFGNGLNNGVGEVCLSLKWLENHLKNRKGFGMRSFRTPFVYSLFYFAAWDC